MNILVVDDSAIARKRVIETVDKFKIENISFAEVEDGLEALEYYIIYKPDLIITDLEMPRMSGNELITKIREIDTKINIIVITALVNEQIRQVLNYDRYLDYLKKPIDANSLKNILLKVKYHIEKKEL